MNRDRNEEKPSNENRTERDTATTPEREGINPLNPSTFPRAEDDDETRAHSPEFHDMPDPGPNVGRNNPGHNF